MDWKVSIEEFESLYLTLTIEDIAQRCDITVDELLDDMASEHKGGWFQRETALPFAYTYKQVNFHTH